MVAYYNEIDPYAAQWLRNLIDAGHIARGDVDERSIVDVRPDDLRGYTQAHWFAGIGGWSIALRLAAWPDDRPVWTGSCPCQPFSAAGAGKAADDERHLWPAWFPLIAERKPAIVFGEQVEAAVGWGWLDAVFADLEGEGYACGAAVLPACGLGAPHIRQRLWFVANAARGSDPNIDIGHGQAGQHVSDVAGTSCGVRGWNDPSRDHESAARNAREARILGLADADGGDASAEGLQRGGEHGQRAEGGGVGELADRPISGRSTQPQRTTGANRRPAEEPGRLRHPSELGHAIGAGLQEQRGQRGLSPEACGAEPRQTAVGTGAPTRGFWSDAEWIACTDGKARPVGPGSFPLGHGIQRRASKLRAYGNAIVPQVAAEFIAAAIE